MEGSEGELAFAVGAVEDSAGVGRDELRVSRAGGRARAPSGARLDRWEGRHRDGENWRDEHLTKVLGEGGG